MRQTLPDLVWMRDSQQKTALYITGWRHEPSARGLCFFAPPFYRFEAHQPWLWGTEAEYPDAAGIPLPALVARRAPDEERFHSIHADILTGIAENRFQKVVPFAVEELEFASDLTWRHWPAAFKNPGPQYAFGFQHQSEGMCGITPELLFHVKGGVLRTMALAGTGPLGGPPLLDDPKEKLEHDLVIEHVCASLKGLGEIEVGATREQIYPHLRHLQTPIEVRLNQIPRFADLISRLHPTAALGGLPRHAALDFLRARAGDRGRFGAPFGFVNGDEMMCVVAIRGVQWSGRRARLASGCGVVAGSVAGREWNELALKRRSAARQLGLEL